MSDQQISNENRKFLLDIARKTIEKKNKDEILSKIAVEKLDRVLNEKRGCFVTLTINGNLRGCIGYILPIEPLYKAVIDNAHNAAFSDPRFPQVREAEVKGLKLEISVLTVPKPLEYKDASDLLNKLTCLKDGVIIKKGFRSATFLPQVWEELPEKEDFLGHLCLKAGFKPDEWKNSSLEVEIYNAEVFEEVK